MEFQTNNNRLLRYEESVENERLRTVWRGLKMVHRGMHPTNGDAPYSAMDILGNFSSLDRKNSGTSAVETRTHNSTNELTARTVAGEAARFWVNDPFTDNNTNGWAVANLNTGGSDGTWAASGTLACSATCAPTGHSGTPANCSILLVDGPFYQDIRVSASGTISTAGPDIGLVFGYRDRLNFWCRVWSLSGQIGNDTTPDTVASGESSETPADARYFVLGDSRGRPVAVTVYDSGGTSNGRIVERIVSQHSRSLITVRGAALASEELGYSFNSSFGWNFARVRELSRDRLTGFVIEVESRQRNAAQIILVEDRCENPQSVEDKCACRAIESVHFCAWQVRNCHAACFLFCVRGCLIAPNPQACMASCFDANVIAVDPCHTACMNGLVNCSDAVEDCVEKCLENDGNWECDLGNWNPNPPAPPQPQPQPLASTTLQDGGS